MQRASILGNDLAIRSTATPASMAEATTNGERASSRCMQNHVLELFYSTSRSRVMIWQPDQQHNAAQQQMGKEHVEYAEPCVLELFYAINEEKSDLTLPLTALDVGKMPTKESLRRLRQRRGQKMVNAESSSGI